jgi:hypothetical protein
MADSADELILAMQHPKAQARATIDARAHQAGLGRLKSVAQKMAWQTQAEILECERIEAAGEKRLEQLRAGGVDAAEAPEYLAVKATVDDAKKRLVRVRAQNNFALDRMDELERREYEAFHAEVRAEAHAQLADDPLGNKPLSEGSKT